MKYLTKEIGPCVVNQTAPGIFALDATASGEGWTQPLAGLFVNEQTLDLAGLSKQEKTIFFSGIAQQDGVNPAVVTGAAGDSLKVFDLISSVPVTDPNSLLKIAIVQNFVTAPGFSGNMPTWEQSIYLLAREFTVDLDTANWGSMLLVSSNQVGSLQPTASDRLYCYRLVVPATPMGAARFDVFPVRYVLGADPREEKEYQYLMRLKKSYDLQQSSDVDGNRPH
jgi:hypothetical protein